MVIISFILMTLMVIQQWDCVNKLDASHSQAYKVQGSRRKWIFLLTLACIFYRLTKLKVYYPLSSVNTFLTIDMEYSNSVPYACHTLPEHNLPFPPPPFSLGTVPLYLLLINPHYSCLVKRKRLPYKPVVKGLTLNSKALRFESSLATKNFPISFCGA